MRTMLALMVLGFAAAAGQFFQGGRRLAAKHELLINVLFFNQAEFDEFFQVFYSSLHYLNSKQLVSDFTCRSSCISDPGAIFSSD